MISKKLIAKSDVAIIIWNFSDKKSAVNIGYWLKLLVEANDDRIEHTQNCANLDGEKETFKKYEGKLYPVAIIANKVANKSAEFNKREIKEKVDVIKEFRLENRIFTTDVKRMSTMKPPFLYLVRQFFGGITVDKIGHKK